MIRRSLTEPIPQYEKGSAPALALEATKERTVARFANYAKSGVLCGNDGLPHLIADPGLALRFGHAGEIFVSDYGKLMLHHSFTVILLIDTSAWV